MLPPLTLDVSQPKGKPKRKVYCQFVMIHFSSSALSNVWLFCVLKRTNIVTKLILHNSPKIIKISHPNFSLFSYGQHSICKEFQLINNLRPSRFTDSA